MPKVSRASVPSQIYRKIGKRGWRDTDYFTFSSSSPMLRRWMAEQILRKRASILSIGCGTGELEKHLLLLNHRVVGLDLSHHMLQGAVRRGLTMPVEADAARLPFAADAFDVVMILEAIGHLDLKKVFGEVRRVLKKRGRLIVTTYTSRQEVAKDYRKFTQAEIAGALTQAALSVEEQKYLETKRSKVKAVPNEAQSTLLYTAAARKD